jgi:predicted lipid-binding transport protein (Tim44 family)
MKFKQRKYWAWGALILPVFSALLLAALDRQQAAASGDWLGFLGLLIQTLMAGLPLFAAHIFASRTSRFTAITIWIAGFVLYPLTIIYLALEIFP